jgi:flagellar basal body-associated protein FliL
MSQKKMEAYKEAKKNRKETIAKEKRQKKAQKILWTVIPIVLALAALVAIAITVVNIVKANQPDYSAFTESALIIDDDSNMKGTTTAAAE